MVAGVQRQSRGAGAVKQRLFYPLAREEKAGRSRLYRRQPAASRFLPQPGYRDAKMAGEGI
jgi:hypothetical protein